jgi:gliding motility-associated-like protein
MKKITLLLLALVFSLSGYSQLALENFEGATFPPTGWNTVHISPGAEVWDVTPSGVCFGAQSAFIDRENLGPIGNNSKDYLTTPLFTVPANGQLKFSTRSSIPGDTGTLYQVRVSTVANGQSNTAGFTLLQTYTENTLSASVTVCEEKTINLTAFIGQQIYISFVKDYTQTVPGPSGDSWILDNVRVVSQCLNPTVQTATALSTSATLGWTNTGGATSFQIENILNSATPTGVATATSATNSFNQTGLTPVTSYKFYVRGLCANGEFSAWVGPFTYITSTAPPVCGGNFVDNGGPAANYTDSADVTTTICPINAGDKVTVTFTSFNTEATWDGLYVFNGNTITALQIASANPAGNVPGGLAGSYWGTTIPGPFTSTAANGCLTFRFRSDSSGNFAGWISNVTCAPPPACIAPTTVVTNAVLATTASVSWVNTGVGTSFQILVLPSTAPAPTATSTGFTTTTTSPFAITGLTASSTYIVYVRSDCSSTSNGFSTWSASAPFTTTALPPACGGFFYDLGGPTGLYPNSADSTITICPVTAGDKVTVTFTAFNTEATWDGLYVFDGNANTSPIIASANPAGNVPGGVAGSYWGTTIPGPFTSTAANGCLTFRFRSDGSFNFAGWAANVTCAPPPTCTKPTILTTSALTATSVSIGWTQLPNPNATTSSSWQILALPCTAPAPTATSTGWTSTTTNPTVVTGLTPSTCYNFYVRSVCSATDSSAWSSPITATTPILPPVCGGNFYDNGGLAANYLNSSDSTITICPTTPGQLVTVTFTSFNTEATWDGLYVFDGNNITTPQIASTNGAGNVPGGLAGSFWGSLTGTNLPGPFTSSATNGCLTFRFRSDASINNPGWAASVTCAPPPTCTKPTTLTATAITQTTATLGWTQLPNPGGASTATAWEILVLPLGSPIPTGSGIPITTNPYTVTGLTAGTGYVYYVRAVCSPTDTSLWSSGFNFFTAPSNDECINAISVPVNADLNCGFTIPVSLAGTTLSTNPNTCLTTTTGDLWYQFTATATTHIITFNNGGFTAFNFALYSGTCGTLTQTFCFTNNSGTASGLTIGTNYYIRVFTTSASSLVPYTLCINTIPCAEAISFCSSTPLTYPNATNTTGLGQIGCLFSSPNPAFFFLKVDQSGPLCYRISQSTIPGSTTTGLLDVDYVAWGPFPDNVTACAAVPLLPLPGLTPAPQTCPAVPHACSFSGQAIEALYIPNALLCQVYVVMITNFSNQPGFVTFTQTNNTPGNGSTACFPYNTFNYSAPSYCQNSTVNPTPIFVTGATTNGIFTAPIGLSINSSTGQINLAASTPGTYNVTNTIGNLTGGICPILPTVTTVRTVTITPPPVATIAYALAPYCKGITTLKLPTRTGTSGGTYSATPAGLNINTISGAILPVGSSAGIYTVTYTIPASGGCPIFTTTASVEILPSIIPTFNPITAVICSGSPSPLPTVSTNATPISGTWTPVYNPTTTTTYTFVPNATTVCLASNIVTLTVTITPNVSPTFPVIAPFCSGTTAPVLPTSSTNTPPIAGTWLPAIVSNVTSGSYVFTPNTTIGVCSIPKTISIVVDPTPVFTISGACQSGQFVLQVNATSNLTTATYVWKNITAIPVIIPATTSSIVISTAGIYSCTATVNGCSTTVVFNANSATCQIQKGISPNGDGVNDSFDLTALDVKHLSIFNRYGIKVYSYTTYTNQWSGQSDKGDILPDGTYYYIIDLANGESKTDWVYINKQNK